MKAKLVAATAGLLLAGATGLVVLAGPGDDPESAGPNTVQLQDFEPAGLSEPPVIDDGDGDEDGGADEADDAQGAEKVAAAIAGEFGVSTDEVLALHDDGIGFGALFKLYAIARAKGITVDELLSTIADDGGGYAFGKMRKELSEEEQEVLDEGPKNLGQLVSESNKNKEHGNPHD